MKLGFRYFFLRAGFALLSAWIFPQVTRAAVAIPFHLNSGGPAYTDTSGEHYIVEAYDSGGFNWVYSTRPVANTSNPTIYLSVRAGTRFGYDIPVANGDYTVQLHFAECSYTGPGQRLFDVSVNGSVVLKKYDIFSDAGGMNTAVRRQVPVKVTGGWIHLKFTSDISGKNAVVAAVDIIAAPRTSSAIKHLITIVQENHSFDSYFGKYCKAAPYSNPTCTLGANCCEAEPARDPGTQALPVLLTDASNLAEDRNHSQGCELAEMDGGKMDMYVSATCGSINNFAAPDPTTLAYYWQLAGRYALADRYFQSIAGPSYSNDVYLARGRVEFINNAYVPQAIGKNCNAPTTSGANFQGTTIGDLLGQSGIPWTFFAEGFDAMASAYAAGSCPAPPPGCSSSAYPCVFDAADDPFEYYTALRDRPEFIADLGQLTSALSAGTLPSVSYVKALGYKSEHPRISNITGGEAFVDDVVNQVLASPYASDTLILLTVDESGGFFDHVNPPAVSSVDNEPYGPRTFLIAIGPFARQTYVSHVRMEHASIIKFVEWNWLGATGQLGTRDTTANNIGSLLDPAKTGVTVPSH